ncbi:hypothetical protein EMGBS15_01210 [Filimonas sp.]|nr:hypothetical protein EMGBS15_01210 [Filimonas sp.]
MDFDDGFVAYLNGKEIARANIGPNQQWNSLALSSAEAQLYQGLQPSYFVLSPAAVDTLLVNGTNVLCVETHNNVANSNDLSARPFLHLGILNSSTNYSPIPIWFIAQTPSNLICPSFQSARWVKPLSMTLVSSAIWVSSITGQVT